MAKIIELKIDNFRRIKAVEIRPDGSLVVISGKNGEGKSSVLYAIWTAFKGRAVAGPVPIRKGAEECTIKAQTEEFTVTRSFKTGKDGEITTDLKVIMKDGRRVSTKPQAMLDALLPDLALDPLDFMRRAPKDQVDTIKALVKGFDFAANQQNRARTFEDRTIANRRAKEAQAAADAIGLPTGPEPKEVDAGALVDKMAQASTHNSDVERRKNARIQAQADVDRLMDEAEALRMRASKMEQDAKALADKLATAEPLPALIDVAAIRGLLASAEAVNATRAKFASKRSYAKLAMDIMQQADALTAELEALDKAKGDAIAKAKLPVQGLSFGEDALTLNGLPFEQASTAEKLRASVAIGMALAPPAEDQALRIMTVDEGSELDNKSMKLLAELADLHGYQVWIARVDDKGEQGFVIEDGQLGG
jgi:recombinational DNA repair ATPase RecF